MRTTGGEAPCVTYREDSSAPGKNWGDVLRKALAAGRFWIRFRTTQGLEPVLDSNSARAGAGFGFEDGGATGEERERASWRLFAVGYELLDVLLGAIACRVGMPTCRVRMPVHELSVRDENMYVLARQMGATDLSTSTPVKNAETKPVRQQNISSIVGLASKNIVTKSCLNISSVSCLSKYSHQADGCRGPIHLYTLAKPGETQSATQRNNTSDCGLAAHATGAERTAQPHTTHPSSTGVEGRTGRSGFNGLESILQKIQKIP